MLVEGSLGLAGVVGTPDQQFVVVAARGELLIVVAPLKSTDFLFVSLQLSFEILWRAQVPMQNTPVTATGRERPTRPGYRAHPTFMTAHAPHQLALVNVPDLQVAGVGAHGQRLTRIRPLNRSYRVIWTEVLKFSHI